MDTENIVWNKHIPAPVKQWVIGAAKAADTPGEEASLRFADWYSEDGVMVASSSPARGRQAISDAHRKAWTGVRSKQHTIDTVYGLDDHGREVIVLGSLNSVLDNGNTMEMSFTVQVIFDTPIGDNLKAKHWQIWIQPQDFGNLIRGEYQEVHTYSTSHHSTTYAWSTPQKSYNTNTLYVALTGVSVPMYQ